MTELTAPRVSIVIPTYNRAPLLAKALDAALAQTYGEIEVVVSDNASTDGTAGILAACSDPRVVKLRQPTLVPPIVNGTACVDAATGQWLLVLSDDDWIAPDCVAKLVAALAAHPTATIAYGRTRKETLAGVEIYTTRPPPRAAARGADFVLAWAEGEREAAFCCTLYDMACLRRLGGFPRFATGDNAARAAIALMGDVVHVPEVLAHYRVHQNSDSHSFSPEQWLEENQLMMDFVRDRLPPELRERFASRGRAHAVRALGVRLGEAMEQGMPPTEAARWLGRMVRRYGWLAVREWPWRPFLVKAAIPSAAIRAARAARNRLQRSGDRS
jgi:glycosyltransferase involved in cell wall biosynthesis